MGVVVVERQESPGEAARRLMREARTPFVLPRTGLAELLGLSYREVDNRLNDRTSFRKPEAVLMGQLFEVDASLFLAPAVAEAQAS